MRGIVGNRFFNQQMFAVRKQGPPHLVMRIRRRRNRSRINHLNKLVERFRRRRAKFFPDGVPSPKIEIVHRGELGRRNLRIEPRVVVPNMPDANDANAQFIHR